MKHHTLSAMSVRVLLLILLPVFFGGCVFRELKKEVAEIHKTFSITGKVITHTSQYESVIVILYSENSERPEAVAYTVPEDTGYFSLLSSEGVYFLMAFEDKNGNLTYDPGEKIGHFGVPDAIRIPEMVRSSKDRKALRDIHIQLSTDVAIPVGAPISVEGLVLNQQSIAKLGRITTLDNEIFAPENGSLGYWKPLTFLRDLGYGIYFLGPYDPGKIPVLFVHGAVGTPAGWKPMIDSMDKNRFQPWFYYYPSGVRLDMAASGLNTLVNELHQTYAFKKLYVTAHSMGGLVSRAFILKNIYRDNHKYIKRFIALSTPWNGHIMTAKGVKQAPEAVPSWHDMVPDSPFIQSLYRKQLKPYVNFSLLFSVRGDCSIFLTNNDGTVEITSELDYRAQTDANHVFGFDEDHGSILTSPIVLEHYNRILNSVMTDPI